jgi:hypothetical protein
MAMHRERDFEEFLKWCIVEIIGISFKLHYNNFNCIGLSLSASGRGKCLGAHQSRGSAVGLLSAHFPPYRAAAVLAVGRGVQATTSLLLAHAEHWSHCVASPIIHKIK